MQTLQDARTLCYLNVYVETRAELLARISHRCNVSKEMRNVEILAALLVCMLGSTGTLTLFIEHGQGCTFSVPHELAQIRHRLLNINALGVFYDAEKLAVDMITILDIESPLHASALTAWKSSMSRLLDACLDDMLLYNSPLFKPIGTEMHRNTAQVCLFATSAVDRSEFLFESIKQLTWLLFYGRNPANDHSAATYGKLDTANYRVGVDVTAASNDSVIITSRWTMHRAITVLLTSGILQPIYRRDDVGSGAYSDTHSATRTGSVAIHGAARTLELKSGRRNARVLQQKAVFWLQDTRMLPMFAFNDAGPNYAHRLNYDIFNKFQEKLFLELVSGIIFSHPFHSFHAMLEAMVNCVPVRSAPYDEIRVHLKMENVTFAAAWESFFSSPLLRLHLAVTLQLRALVIEIDDLTQTQGGKSLQYYAKIISYTMFPVKIVIPHRHNRGTAFDFNYWLSYYHANARYAINNTN